MLYTPTQLDCLSLRLLKHMTVMNLVLPFYSTIWINSPRPFPIEISLRIIRDTIRGDGVVHPLCFNLAVRKITTDAAERTAGTSSVGKTHFFNLGFHEQARALRQTWLSQEQRTNALINNVVLEPFPRYCVFHTPTIVSFLILIN